MGMRLPTSWIDELAKSDPAIAARLAMVRRDEGKPFSSTVDLEGEYAVHLMGNDRGFGDWAKGTAIVVEKDKGSPDELEREGGWRFAFEVKHFQEGSEFGIDGGRISKLMICAERTCSIWSACVVNYDRGWDITTAEYKKAVDAAYNAILKQFN